MPEEKSVLIERRSGALTLSLNRPSAHNALSPDMVETLLEALSTTQHTDICIIKGVGKNFCAGFDLSEIDDLTDGDLLWRFLRIEKLLQTVHHARFPIVAAVQGHVIGAGADLFAACWHRVAAHNAQFKMPGWNFELALGTRRLSNLIGSDAARDMLIDSQSVEAGEARRMGLVSQIVDPEDWDQHLIDLKRRCSALPPFSKEHMLSLTVADMRDHDMAAIVRTAGRPGLKDRITTYQRQVANARNRRREELQNA